MKKKEPRAIRRGVRKLRATLVFAYVNPTPNALCVVVVVVVVAAKREFVIVLKTLTFAPQHCQWGLPRRKGILFV